MSQYIINPFFQFGDQPPQTRNAWVELGRHTLGGPADSMSVAVPNKRYYMIIYHIIPSGATNAVIRLNGDSGANYADRVSQNGGADVPQTLLTGMLNLISGNRLTDYFGVFFIDNLTDAERFGQGHVVFATATTISPSTPANAPARVETIGKWTNRIDPITTISVHNAEAGDFGTGSELIILGFDPTDGLEATANFWQELADVNADGVGGFSVPFTAKKYLWVQGYFIPSVSSIGFATFNGDVGVKYADRSSTNGLADGTTVSAVRFFISGTFVTPTYYEAFIINLANNQKLIIGHTINQNTLGPANVPARYEIVNKWTDVVAQISSIDFFPTVGNYFPSSKVKVWGHD